MPTQPNFAKNAVTVLERRYLQKDDSGNCVESPSDMLRRVAATIAAVDENPKSAEKQFFELMASLDFMPNSPTLMNAGRPLGQLSACFVLPVGDSMEEIFEAIKQTALIHKSGGGTGFSFSRLRPSDSAVNSTQGVASGPISFMRVFDAATETIKQGGTRRGANMGILRVDHPEILKFIECKSDQTQLTNFNISIGVTEAFFKAVRENEDYDLVHPASKEVCGQLNASEVFDKIVKLAWKNGEPGIVFLDRMNAENPTPEIGEFEATNPCGEQPLLPYESCNLGSINLKNFVSIVNGKPQVDFRRLAKVAKTSTRFLNNVIDANKYPLPEIDKMTKANRKIGLGVMGWADMLLLLGIPYGSQESLELADKVMETIDSASKAESCRIAEVNGAFPNFSKSIYANDGQPKIANATTTTIAPTGTISIICNTSSSVEPLFAVAYQRNVLDNDILVEVNPIFESIAKEQGFYSDELMKKIAKTGSIQSYDEIPEEVRRVFLTSHDISPEAHIKMQAAFQKHVDNAVSKTINFRSSATEEDVRKSYELAYKLGCKGLTIYRDGSRDEQVLSTTKSDEKSQQIELEVAALPAEPKKPVGAVRTRPKSLRGSTYEMQTGCGPIYVTINEDDKGAFELFTTMGKAGGCASSQCEAIGRLISLGWRSDVQARQTYRQLIGITCHKPSGFGESRVKSCADAVAQAIGMHLEHGIDEAGVGATAAVSLEEPAYSYVGGACPECGGVVEQEGGCSVCKSCGYSECA